MAGTTIATIILSCGLFTIPAVVIGTVSGISLATIGTTTTINKSFIGKRINHFKKKYELSNEYLNKLEMYFEKAKNDNVISLKEIEEFNNIILKYQELRCDRLQYSKNLTGLKKVKTKKLLTNEQILQIKELLNK